MLEALDARDGEARKAMLVEHLLHKPDSVPRQLRAGEIYPRASCERR